MNTDYNMAEHAILMRLCIGLPGEQRQDADLTGEVKASKNLGAQSGKWIKNLYPVHALAAIKKLDNEARAYHAAVTLPFDAGIGILPATLILEHGEKMRHFAGLREKLVDDFLANPQQWVDWAAKEHNGTFDPEQYAGCRKETAAGEGRWVIDADAFRATMRPKFHFEVQPLPVPNAAHFEKQVASLLGTDAETVNWRVRDAAIEAQRELLRRLLAPVQKMAQKLAEQPKVKANGEAAEDIIFRDTLVENVKEIAKLAPKLNLNGDPVIAGFCKDIEALAVHDADALRKDKALRATQQAKAKELADKLSGYTL